MDYTEILKAIHRKGTTGNVMEVLGWDAVRFEEGFRIAHEMDNLNYVKILYSNFNRNLIAVELTLLGIELSKIGKAR